MKKKKPMVNHIPITEARINLGQLVKKVCINKECFVLEKSGIPVAGIINIGDFEDWLELNDPAMSRQITHGYTEYQQGQTKSIDELINNLKENK